jgi:electron transfer flavoprotein alpha subunit
VIGVAVVRSGRLTLGSADVLRWVDELWLIGDRVAEAPAPAGTTRRVELGTYAPAAWVTWLAGQVGEQSVVLAASPDGRDLAGRLAEALERELYAGCLAVSDHQVVVPVFGGASTTVAYLRTSFVATVQPSTRRGDLVGASGPAERVALGPAGDLDVDELRAPDLESVDLSDAQRIVAGGAGLARESDFTDLAELGVDLEAALGATRVITDRGWVPVRRQIGTTGVTVTPSLYVAFGISGAVQHTSGLGSPEHVISVNLDAACPMSQMADVAIVADASATLAALLERLGERS